MTESSCPEFKAAYNLLFADQIIANGAGLLGHLVSLIRIISTKSGSSAADYQISFDSIRIDLIRFKCIDAFINTMGKQNRAYS